MAAAKKSNTTSAAIFQRAAAAILKSTKKKVVTKHKGALPFVPSGSFVIDDLIGGAPASDGKPVCPGYPRRRITEVFGAESSGKTTATLEAIAEVQKRGEVAMFLDFEHALHHEYSEKIGVKWDDKTFMPLAPENLEEGIKMIYVGIKAGVSLIVVDSVASMVTKDEMEKGIDKPSMIGDRARAFAKFLPRIVVWLTEEIKENPEGTALVFINQTRALIGDRGHGGEDNTTGGKALKFFSYLRLRFTRIRSDVWKKKDRITGKEKSYPYGNHTQVKIIKSKVDGKQGYTADIFIRFGLGIDDYHSLIEGGINNKLISKNGSTLGLNGQTYRGKEALRAFLIKDEKTMLELRKKLLEALKVTPTSGDDDEDDGEITMADFGPDEDGDAEVEAIEAEVEVEASPEGEAEGGG